jgi:hypothetical protein
MTLGWFAGSDFGGLKLVFEDIRRLAQRYDGPWVFQDPSIVDGHAHLFLIHEF